MHLEVAILTAKDGDSEGLVEAMRGGGCDALASAPGCHSVKVYPGVEQPGNVLFLVEWDSVEAHNNARTSEGFLQFYEIASPWFDPDAGGSMQHFDIG